MNTEEKINNVARRFGSPQQVNQLLTHIKSSGNFNYYLDKIEVHNSEDILAEIRAAAWLKESCNKKVIFLTDKYGQGKELPTPINGKNYNCIRRPDMYFKYKGNNFFVEVKKIRIDKFQVLKQIFSHPFDLHAHRSLITKKIMEIFEDDVEQIENFGNGYLYIESGKAQLDSIAISRVLNFTDHPSVISLILAQPIWDQFAEKPKYSWQVMLNSSTQYGDVLFDNPDAYRLPDITL